MLLARTDDELLPLWGRTALIPFCPLFEASSFSTLIQPFNTELLYTYLYCHTAVCDEVCGVICNISSCLPHYIEVIKISKCPRLDLMKTMPASGPKASSA